MGETRRIEAIHTLISTFVIAYVVAIEKLLMTNTVISPYADQLLAFLTSIGFYRILFIIAFWIANRNAFALRLLWGKEYVHGLWTYSYDFKGEKRFGIWRIVQTIYGVSITGYGLDAQKKIRSTFKSITPLINNQGLYEIVFLRTITSQPDRQHIAKATLYLDTFKKGRLHAAPTVIRSQSLIFGGLESGMTHIDVIARKHDNAVSEDQIVAEVDTSKA
jgi:hypothetical protein